MKRRGQKRQEHKARRFAFEAVGPTRIYNKLCWDRGGALAWRLSQFDRRHGRSRLFMQAWITLSLRWQRGENL